MMILSFIDTQRVQDQLLQLFDMVRKLIQSIL